MSNNSHTVQDISKSFHSISDETAHWRSILEVPYQKYLPFNSGMGVTPIHISGIIDIYVFLFINLSVMIRGRVNMALSESELVTKIEKLLQEKFSTELTFREISAGYGIADLVFAPSETRNTINREPITHFGTLKFFIELGKKQYSIAELYSLNPYLPRHDLRKSIAFLLNNGYLEQSVDGTFQKKQILFKNEPIQKIIAIEAKLTDYRSGIVQARRYQYFADQSYLAILKTASKHIDTDSLLNSGIGLILFDEISETITVQKPKRVVDNVQEKVYRLFARELMLNRLTTSVSKVQQLSPVTL